MTTLLYWRRWVKFAWETKDKNNCAWVEPTQELATRKDRKDMGRALTFHPEERAQAVMRQVQISPAACSSVTAANLRVSATSDSGTAARPSGAAAQSCYRSRRFSYRSRQGGWQQRFLLSQHDFRLRS